jgi:hypothetical protein
MNGRIAMERLFNRGEFTCFSRESRGTRVYPIENFDPEKHVFYSINPLRPDGDNKPTQWYHDAKVARRADCNVIAYRNILIEMDNVPIQEQIELVRNRLGLAYTSITFSGKKSYHVIISLADDLISMQLYISLVRRIYRLFDGCVDTKCKNPSRFSRCPGSIRPDTESVQALIELRERVPIEVLETILVANGIVEEPDSHARICPNSAGAQPKRNTVKRSHPDQGIIPLQVKLMRLPTFVSRFLREGAPAGSWNDTLFRASCCAANSQIDNETWIRLCERITGQLDQSDHTTIKSAYSRAE